MFIRVKSTPNSPRKSIQIVENVRHGDKIKQKIVHYVGIALDDDEEAKLKELANDLIAKITLKRQQSSPQPDMFPINTQELSNSLKTKLGRRPRKKLEDIIPPEQITLVEVEETARLIEGVHEVGNVVFNELGYNSILKTKRDISMLRDLVLTRLVFPCSKYKLQRIMDEQFGKGYSLDSIYYLMDKIAAKVDDIKQITFTASNKLFPGKIDVIFFDVTTLYFESTNCDEIREFGYSKDCRFNTTQVVLALATNEDGLPIGYELFPGNQAEVKTLVAAITGWQKTLSIGAVCFVGDRAMFSEGNISLLEKHGYTYVIAAKLRALPAKLKEDLLLDTNYRTTVIGKTFGWVGEFDYKGRRLISSYKTSRAIKNAKDRNRIIDKIKKKIGNEGMTDKLISNYGIKKYTTTNKGSTTMIDEDKISLDSSWDGLHGIITNDTKSTPEELIVKYSKLWRIEESFRINKHLLEMRPIFHWRPERIKAHIAICYMSFAILRHLQYRVNLTQKISYNMILEELMNVQSSIYAHKKTKDLYRMPGKFTNNARKIYKAYQLERSLDPTPYIS